MSVKLKEIIMNSEKKRPVGRPKQKPSILDTHDAGQLNNILVTEDRISIFVLRLAQALEKERQAQDVPKGELSKKADISYQNYFKFEQGLKKTTISTIESLASALNMTLEDLWVKAFGVEKNATSVTSVEELLAYQYHYVFSHSLVDKLGKSAISLELDATMALRIITKLLAMADQVKKASTQKSETTEIEFALETVKNLLESIEKSSEGMKKDIINNL